MCILHRYVCIYLYVYIYVSIDICMYVYIHTHVPKHYQKMVSFDFKYENFRVPVKCILTWSSLKYLSQPQQLHFTEKTLLYP